MLARCAAMSIPRASPGHDGKPFAGEAARQELGKPYSRRGRIARADHRDGR
jgi:hypothetical protein